MNSDSRVCIFFALLVSLPLLPGVSCQTQESFQPKEIVLSEGWKIQASSRTEQRGEILSSENASTEGWFATSTPRTVLAALTSNEVFSDPYFGKNMEKIDLKQFQQAWWYRCEFAIEDLAENGLGSLIFEGINYRANIWLNGSKLADQDEVVGAFRMFQFDVSQQLQEGQNYLAVQVFPPEPGDFTIGFVDWNPTPPDRNMGLWRPIKLRLTGPIAAETPFVSTKVDLETLAEADITVSTTLWNSLQEEADALVHLKIGDREIHKNVSLNPRGLTDLTFHSKEFQQLKILNPRLWWPNNLGEQNLYELEMTVEIDNRVSDTRNVTFGIREVGDYFNEEGHRGYTVNGKKVLIRGAGWVDDLMLDDNTARVDTQMRYARHMNLNTIRLEGFWGSSQTLYDLADRYGLLLMAGWSCQWEWEDYLGKPVDEFGGVKTPEDIRLVSQSLKDQVVWLRNHPSVLVWVFGSDMLPRPELEKSYNSILEKVDPTRPVLAACSIRKSEISGSTGVKMNGPYDFVTPNYWYEDQKRGGAFGFNTETGPGPQPPPLESLKRMIPESDLWPIGDVWNYHCGRHQFHTMDRYLNALKLRYGEVTGVEQFARIAQVANYEAMRPMFEAFGVNKHNATGVIQWMLNSAWPETYWQLYDWYLMPNGAFYGAKAASRPVHIVYNYGDGNIYGVNDTLVAHPNIRAEIRVFNADSREVFKKELLADFKENSSSKIFEMPRLKGLSQTYFLDLRLFDEIAGLVSSNFYWLSTRKDVLDDENSLWFVTPNKSFADFKKLQKLPPATVVAETEFSENGDYQRVNVTLENASDSIAFFIELKLVGEESGRSILPVYWSDNYISLLPGEKGVFEAEFSKPDPEGEKLFLEFSGINVVPGAQALSQ